MLGIQGHPLDAGYSDYFMLTDLLHNAEFCCIIVCVISEQELKNVFICLLLQAPGRKPGINTVYT